MCKIRNKFQVWRGNGKKCDCNNIQSLIGMQIYSSCENGTEKSELNEIHF